MVAENARGESEFPCLRAPPITKQSQFAPASRCYDGRQQFQAHGQGSVATLGPP